MSTGWMHIDVGVLSHLLNLPEGALTLKAEASDGGRKIGILVDHDDIPPEADWVSAQFIRADGGPAQFDKWLVIPNGSKR